MVGAGDVPWRQVGETRIVVRVRLTPKASRDAIDGVGATRDGAAFKARVRAVPQDGAANAALERLFSVWLLVPKSSVEVERGGKSRIKTVSISGEIAAIAAKLSAKLDEFCQAATTARAIRDKK